MLHNQSHASKDEEEKKKKKAFIFAANMLKMSLTYFEPRNKNNTALLYEYEYVVMNINF